MDYATRIKVLGRLAQSRTSAAEEAVGRACAQAFASLADGTEYEILEFALEVLATVGFRRSTETVKALNDFFQSIEKRQLAHADEYGAMVEILSKYRNAHTLMAKAMKVLSGLRYLETNAVVDALLWASTHSDESVRRDAISALGVLAKYNLSVYSGEDTDSQRGIGATPQLAVIETLERKNDEYLKHCLRGVLTLLDGLLSTSMESARWSSTEVTLLRATTPADSDILAVRKRSLRLGRRLYKLVQTKSDKLSVIRAMNAAARGDGRGYNNKTFTDMISANALDVLAFFGEVANAEEDLQIVQKLEHDSYWIHFHSPSAEVRSAALEVKAIIDANVEYGIYKTLVGFEGVFGNWSKDRQDESYALGSQESRQKQARVIAARIQTEGFDSWRCRILRFAQTESNDLATFPVFYEFLAEVATAYPEFALSLLAEESEKLSRFLIPILRGIWDGKKREDLLPLMLKWIDEARPDETTFLYACAKVFLSTKDLDIGVLDRLLDKATELRDAFAIRQVASVAVGRPATEEVRRELKELFLRALRCLTELNDAGWVREIWFRKEVTEMVSQFTPDERREVLNNLHFLPQIDYQAEDVLAAIAECEPGEVVNFLCDRLYESDERVVAIARSSGGEYEELPYEFQTLQGVLSRDPKMVIRVVLGCYIKDNSLFRYRGAKLLQAIFSQFSDGFEVELLRLAREGNELEIEFVVSVLRAYDGQNFIHSVVKELIKRLPSESELLNEVAIALRSTGVVMGEYGMAEAYERIRLEVLQWFRDPHERIRAFAAKFVEELEHMRDLERRRADESIALRKFEYGEK